MKIEKKREKCREQREQWMQAFRGESGGINISRIILINHTPVASRYYEHLISPIATRAIVIEPDIKYTA